MKVVETPLAGVIEVRPRRIADQRGWFSETWNSRTFAEAGLAFDWVQDNESLSLAAGTVRGIHFQVPPNAQDKLVRSVAGKIFDVAVDLRRSSATFGRWAGVQLDAEIGNQLLIPKGFGHAFATLTDNCRVAYKVTSHYDADTDRCIAWDDSDIGIDWPIDTAAARVSEKDRLAPLLSDVEVQLFA